MKYESESEMIYEARSESEMKSEFEMKSESEI